jgi:hypothetical protein
MSTVNVRTSNRDAGLAMITMFLLVGLSAFVVAAFVIVVMVLLAARGGRSQAPSTPREPATAETGRLWVTRGGQLQPADETFEAWTSGELPRMLTMLDKPSNPIDRHFLLLGIAEAAYRERDDPDKRALFHKVAEQHRREFPGFVNALSDEFDGELPRVPTFQYLATVLAEDGQFDEAVEVCEEALSLGLHDGTQSGFEGRIARIRKMKGKVER